MADPIVSITAGIPTSGTGTITTLGQTIAVQGSLTSSQTTGGPLAQGAATTGAPSYTTGTINPLSLDTSGNLRVAMGGTMTVSGTVTANQGGAPWSMNVSQFGGAAVVTGTGIGGAGIPRVTVSSDSSLAATQSGTWNINNISGTISLPTGAATSAKQPALGTAGAPSADVITVQGIVGGTAQPVSLSGNVTVVQPTAANLNATVTGTVAVSGVSSVKPDGTTWTQTGSSANVNVTNTVATTLASTTITGTVAVTQSTTPWTCAGDVAAGSADSGNPQKFGGQARITNPAAVSDGQRVNAIFDKLGKQICVGAVRVLKGIAKQSVVNTTETTIISAGGAGVFNDVYAIVVTNKSAVSLFVDFKDSTGGTTRMTLACPASDTRGFTVPVDSAMIQATAANAWTATLSGTPTSASVEISMLYVSNL